MGILNSKVNSDRPVELFQFTQGIEVDRRLAFAEIRVQRAWAIGLGKIQVLNAAEVSQVSEILGEAEKLIREEKFEWRVEDEDVHMNLERFVTEKAGVLGKRMHLGRSRNDLIATTLRVFLKDALSDVSMRVEKLISALVLRAEKDIDILVPGMTHLQNGQPVRYSHILLAHAWPLKRDLEILKRAADQAMGPMPLGSAALAGTPLSIDLSAIATDLGFSSVSLNSYDSVGDRDFMLSALDAMAHVAIHLSRFSEDVIFWSSSAVGLVKLPKKWSTGSSIMPNKRNPDIAELTRAKSAHVIAAQTNGYALLKALPTSYDSDLHEMKTVVLRAFDELTACLEILPYFVAELEVDLKQAQTLLNKGHLLATEIADELSAKGVPFREAYVQVAALVQDAEKKGVQVHELESVAQSNLTFENAVERRQAVNGTARARVKDQILALRKTSPAS